MTPVDFTFFDLECDEKPEWVRDTPPYLCVPMWSHPWTAEALKNVLHDVESDLRSWTSSPADATRTLAAHLENWLPRSEQDMRYYLLVEFGDILCAFNRLIGHLEGSGRVEAAKRIEAESQRLAGAVGELGCAMSEPSVPVQPQGDSEADFVATVSGETNMTRALSHVRALVMLLKPVLLGIADSDTSVAVGPTEGGVTHGGASAPVSEEVPTPKKGGEETSPADPKGLVAMGEAAGPSHEEEEEEEAFGWRDLIEKLDTDPDYFYDSVGAPGSVLREADGKELASLFDALVLQVRSLRKSYRRAIACQGRPGDAGRAWVDYLKTMEGVLAVQGLNDAWSRAFTGTREAEEWLYRVVGPPQDQELLDGIAGSLDTVHDAVEEATESWWWIEPSDEDEEEQFQELGESLAYLHQAARHVESLPGSRESGAAGKEDVREHGDEHIGWQYLKEWVAEECAHNGRTIAGVYREADGQELASVFESLVIEARKVWAAVAPLWKNAGEEDEGTSRDRLKTAEACAASCWRTFRSMLETEAWLSKNHGPSKADELLDLAADGLWGIWEVMMECSTKLPGLSGTEAGGRATGPSLTEFKQWDRTLRQACEQLHCVAARLPAPSPEPDVSRRGGNGDGDEDVADAVERPRVGKELIDGMRAFLEANPGVVFEAKELNKRMREAKHTSKDYPAQDISNVKRYLRDVENLPLVGRHYCYKPVPSEPQPNA